MAKLQYSNQEIGVLGEEIATNFLIQKGWTICERNWRYKHLEVDIIAFDGKILRIVEVKLRSSIQYGYPEERIMKDKMKHLKVAAQIYQQKNPQYKLIQFDVVSILYQRNKVQEIFYFEDVYIY
ncbi:MAG: YraN family protein [Sediminibacterium sp.]|nr:YraN family protein [Sediminibacterium sp.]